MPNFKPEESEAWYYKIPSPFTQQSAVYTTFIEPLVTSTSRDPSCGRYTLPYNPYESRFRDDSPSRMYDRRIYLNQEKTEWIYYRVLQDKTAIEHHNRKADLIFCHGINDYGGGFCKHAQIFLQAGYRLVLPDLFSHGRSTGLHAYLQSMGSLAEAVDAVICDMATHDRKEGCTDTDLDTRKRFIAGASMGGFTALYYTIQYPSVPASNVVDANAKRIKSTGSKRPKIDGALLLCPMLEISPESRPSLLVEYIGRAIAKFAGRWPMAAANRGKNSEDPAVDEEFEADPQTYSGKIRISTGLAILHGIADVNARLAEVTLPFKVLHGTGDRVTSYKGSQRLYDMASSQDKEIKLYDGREHVLLRKGRDKEGDTKRQDVLKDMLEWLERH